MAVQLGKRPSVLSTLQQLRFDAVGLNPSANTKPRYVHRWWGKVGVTERAAHGVSCMSNGALCSCQKINRSHAHAHDSRTNHSHEHREEDQGQYIFVRVNPISIYLFIYIYIWYIYIYVRWWGKWASRRGLRTASRACPTARSAPVNIMVNIYIYGLKQNIYIFHLFMYIYIHVCIYIYMCVCLFIHSFIHMCIYTYV